MASWTGVTRLINFYAWKKYAAKSMACLNSGWLAHNFIHRICAKEDKSFVGVAVVFHSSRLVMACLIFKHEKNIL